MKMKKYLAIALCAVLLLMGLSACGKTAAIVTVNDRGVITEIEARLPETVEKILQDAEIMLNEGDEVEPGLTTELTEAGEIVINRKNTVTLTVDGETKEVVIIGGTVADLLAKEGITLAENQHVNVDMDKYLTDGMEIEITTTYTVTILHDGEEEEVEVNAGTVQDALDVAGLTLGEDDRIDPGVDTEIKEGMEIEINRVTFEEVKETEEIDFETERVDDGNLAVGTEETETEGVKGEKTTTYKVTMVDGEEESREVVKEEVTKEPVKEVIRVGTYEEPVQQEPAQQEPAQQENTGPVVVNRVPIYSCINGSLEYYEIYWSDGHGSESMGSLGGRCDIEYP